MSLKVHELQPILEPIGYSKIYSEFLTEANTFSTYLDHASLSNVLKDFNDFNRYLKKNTKKIVSNSKVSDLSKGSNILSAKNATGEFKLLLSYAHYSACCELFNGWTFNSSGDINSSFCNFLEKNLSHLKTADKQTINNIYLRIPTADTVRILVLLKLLGVLQIDTSKKRILSFGAASGVKELYSTHTEPKITGAIDGYDKHKFSLSFSRLLKWPKQTVLIDYDNYWHDHYQNLTATHQSNVLGIIDEFDRATYNLPDKLLEANMDPVDLVFGWRIDHQVIPNVKTFFKNILPSLSSKSQVDLIITIGAGDDDLDFAGRVQAMDAIWEFLKVNKHNPVRIVLYDRERDYPLFGHGSYATYEVIYCRLNKKILKKLL